MRSAENVEVRTVDPVAPALALTPANLPFLLERLVQVRDRLVDLGFPIASSGRVASAVRVIDEASRGARYPVEPREVLKLADAIAFAMTLVQVIDAMRHQVPVGLVESLRKSLGGVLGDVSPSTHRRALSELHFGAAIAASGLSIGAPRPRATATPDFVVTVDTVPFLVEVKRPSSVKKIHRALREGIGQCRAYDAQPIAIALDLSDVLPHRLAIGEPSEVEAENGAAFEAATEIARSYVVAPPRGRRVDDIALLLVYAQVVLLRPDPDNPRPVTGMHTHFERFKGAKQGLIQDHSGRLRHLVEAGHKAILGSLNVPSSGV